MVEHNPIVTATPSSTVKNTPIVIMMGFKLHPASEKYETSRYTRNMGLILPLRLIGNWFGEPVADP